MAQNLVLTYTKIIPEVVGAKSRNFLVAALTASQERTIFFACGSSERDTSLLNQTKMDSNRNKTATSGNEFLVRK